MAEPLSTYKKLTGGPINLLVNHVTLWYGDDHLVCVSSVFGNETYQRVYYRDIEAFLLKPTKGRLIWNIIFGSIAVFAAIVAARARTLYPDELDGPLFAAYMAVVTLPLILLGGVGVIALIALIINTVRGRTCTFWAQTRGGVTRLGAPVRIPAARRVVNTLTPLIARAQGSPLVNTPVAP